jgi:hypothetical protein
MNSITVMCVLAQRIFFLFYSSWFIEFLVVFTSIFIKTTIRRIIKNKTQDGAADGRGGEIKIWNASGAGAIQWASFSPPPPLYY